MDGSGWGEGGNQRPDRLSALPNGNGFDISRRFHDARRGWGKLLMEIYFPFLLSRKKAMLMFKISRNKLEKLAKSGLIRTFTTKGGHKRYFRDDLIKTIYEEV